MTTIFRDLSYRYQWLYDGISRLAALSVGGEPRFRQLALQNLNLQSDTQILDLCCGSGQVTRFLVNFSENVTGLDASPLSIKRCQKNVPNATYIKAFAEDMPFADNLFDVVHTSSFTRNAARTTPKNHSRGLSGIKTGRSFHFGGFSPSYKSDILAGVGDIFLVV